MFNKKTILPIIVLTTIITGAFLFYTNTHDKNIDIIAEYYSIIENQERERDDVRVTDEDLKTLNDCQKIGDRCMRTFYDNYTMKHGVDLAFAHLARLQKEYPRMLPRCHYISHGIGNAALRLNSQDVSKAFSVVEQGGVFKNIATCGNGYFHGVIEEVAKDTTDKDELVRILSRICDNATTIFKGGCFHGIGHAAIIQTDFSIEDMLYVCDRISDRTQYVFACHTGGFMEHLTVFYSTVSVENGVVNFSLCDSLEEKYQPACYLEYSTFFERLSKGDRDYVKNIGFCKEIENDLNRMACIKLFAIRAVRIAHFKDIREMCLNTSSSSERVMCTAVVADKIAGSMGSTRKSQNFKSVADEVCETLNPLYAQYCKYIVYNSSQLFLTTEKDLKPPSLGEIFGRLVTR